MRLETKKMGSMLVAMVFVVAIAGCSGSSAAPNASGEAAASALDSGKSNVPEDAEEARAENQDSSAETADASEPGDDNPVQYAAIEKEQAPAPEEDANKESNKESESVPVSDSNTANYDSANAKQSDDSLFQEVVDDLLGTDVSSDSNAALYNGGVKEEEGDEKEEAENLATSGLEEKKDDASNEINASDDENGECDLSEVNVVVVVPPDPDSDEDGLFDKQDNCPLLVNAGQEDWDDDGLGDLCDDDWDNDGIINSVDNCSLIANADQANMNNDAIGDACDGRFDSIHHTAGQLGGEGRLDGFKEKARFNQARNVATDGKYLYVSDLYNYTLRKIALSGLAPLGKGFVKPGVPFFGFAKGKVSSFSSANGWGMEMDSIGKYLYFGSYSGNSLDRVDLTTDEVISFATFEDTCWPSGIVLDEANAVGFAACNKANLLYKFSLVDGSSEIIAGKSGEGEFVDALEGSQARFNGPEDITICGGYIYLADSHNNAVRQISMEPPYAVITLAKSDLTDWSSLEDKLYGPTGIDCRDNKLYISNTHSHHISQIDLDCGEVSIYAGTPGAKGQVAENGLLSESGFFYPRGLTIRGDKMYVADMYNYGIDEIDMEAGTISVLAGKAREKGSEDGDKEVARFWDPKNAVVVSNNLYVTQMDKIRKTNMATGKVSTFFDQGADDIAFDGKDFYIMQNTTLSKLSMDGQLTFLAGGGNGNGYADGIGSGAQFKGMAGITVDEEYVYVADWYNHVIRQVNKLTGQVETICGVHYDWTEKAHNFQDGACATAFFDAPGDLVKIGKKLYITEIWGQAIRVLDLETMSVSTLAKDFSLDLRAITTDGSKLYVASLLSQPAVYSVRLSDGGVTKLIGDDYNKGVRVGELEEASVNRPWGMVFDALTKQLFIMDNEENAILQLQ